MGSVLFKIGGCGSFSAKCCFYFFNVKSQKETIVSSRHLSVHLHRFLGGWAVRGGVTGRPEFIPPYWYLAFFSDGFRIWEEEEEELVITGPAALPGNVS